MVFPPQSDWPAETSDLGDTVSPSQSDWPAKVSDPIPLSWVTWCSHLSLTGQLRLQTWVTQCPHLSLTGQLRCQPNTIELGDMVSPSQSDWPVEAVDLELNETVSTLV